MQKHKPKKLHLLKCFFDDKRHYYVLIKNGNGWHWVHLSNGSYFSKGHRTKYEAMIGAKDQGAIKRISLDYLYPNMNAKEGYDTTKLVSKLKKKLRKDKKYGFASQFVLKDDEIKLIIEILGEL